MPFVFYDTETTGSNAWYDQILQFAAISVAKCDHGTQYHEAEQDGARGVGQSRARQKCQYGAEMQKA